MTLRKRNYIYESRDESEEVEFKGKKGVWRRVANHNIFFPSDGSDPLGIPKKKGTMEIHKDIEKVYKKHSFFNTLRDKLSDKRLETSL